jgi:hypothetical protein
MGDEFNVGPITGAQGVAIGTNASAIVTGQNVSGDVRIDADELRAALDDLYDAIEGLDLPRDERIAVQTAAGSAIAGVSRQEVNAETVTSNVETVGHALQQADTVIQQGTSLWEHVTRLASLLGPFVGGAQVVAGWFGIQVS